MSDSTLRIVWIYPDLLSTYGDRGNLLILARRAALRGIPVETYQVRSDMAMPTTADIYLIGGGEDGPQALAAQRLIADGGLHRAVAQGSAVLGHFARSPGKHASMVAHPARRARAKPPRASTAARGRSQAAREGAACYPGVTRQAAMTRVRIPSVDNRGVRCERRRP